MLRGLGWLSAPFPGQEGWSSVPALESLKLYKNILKFTNPLILPQELEVAVVETGLKGTSQEKSITSTKLEILEDL